MALDFPASPVDGQAFSGYKYDLATNSWIQVGVHDASDFTEGTIFDSTLPVRLRATISIPSGADLNSYISQGVYHQDANSWAAAGTNYPVALAGLLEVFNASGSNYVYQRYTAYANSGAWTREAYQGTWQPWRSVLPKPISRVYVDTTSRSISTAWTLGPTFSNIGTFQGNSKIYLRYHVPSRNNTTLWGGLYVEPQVRFNLGTWQSLGSSGYDLMLRRGPEILTYSNSCLIDPGLSTPFSAQFRLYYKGYDDTALINNANRDINSIAGTQNLVSGDNGLQHYTHIIVEEILG